MAHRQGHDRPLPQLPRRLCCSYRPFSTGGQRRKRLNEKRKIRRWWMGGGRGKRCYVLNMFVSLQKVLVDTASTSLGIQLCVASERFNWPIATCDKYSKSRDQGLSHQKL